MKDLDIRIPFAAKAALAVVALAWLMLMGWAFGQAFDNDGYAHSRAAFGAEYEYTEEQTW